jgi:hypothetical protein
MGCDGEQLQQQSSPQQQAANLEQRKKVENLVAEKRQRFETSATYKLSKLAEQGKTILRTFVPSIPSRYYKGTIYWSNRFVEDRMKISVQFDADWFGERWDYGLEKISDTTSKT